MGKHLNIVAMGNTREGYISARLMTEGFSGDEGDVWAINLMGGLIQCDRIIAMDNPKLWKRVFAPAVWQRVMNSGVPIYTGVPDTSFCPTAVAYPLEDVLKRFGHPYFNNSVPYAIALAMLETALAIERGQPDEGYSSITLFGCDYHYDGASVHENGRPCVEYWCARAQDLMGIQIGVAQGSNLLDSNKVPVRGIRPLYGYPEDFDWRELMKAPEPIPLKEAAE